MAAPLEWASRGMKQHVDYSLNHTHTSLHYGRLPTRQAKEKSDAWWSPAARRNVLWPACLVIPETRIPPLFPIVFERRCTNSGLEMSRSRHGLSPRSISIMSQPNTTAESRSASRFIKRTCRIDSLSVMDCSAPVIRAILGCPMSLPGYLETETGWSRQ